MLKTENGCMVAASLSYAAWCTLAAACIAGMEQGLTQQALTSHHKQLESSVLHGVHVLVQGWD